MESLRLVDYQSPLLIDSENLQFYDCESCPNMNSSYEPPKITQINNDIDYSSECSFECKTQNNRRNPAYIFNSITMETSNMECHKYLLHCIFNFCDNSIVWIKKIFNGFCKKMSFNKYSANGYVKFDK